MTKDHMKQVLQGNKKLLLRKDVNEIVVPFYDELSVKAWYDKMLTRPELQPYFPERYAKGRQADREYFWNVCNTFFPEEVTALIEHASMQRFAVGHDAEEADRIHMTDEWAALLERFPCKPAKKGKMMHLLKLKSKKIEAVHKRKTYPALDILTQISQKKPAPFQMAPPANPPAQ